MTRIVAAVDGSESAVRAAVWAASEAVRAGGALRLVHAYVVPLHGYPDFVSTFSELRDGMRHQGRQWLDEARAAVEAAQPEVAVEAELVEGAPTTVLLSESRHARSLVLGSRGLGGFTGMLVGSVAVALAAHGHCPVIVVRGDEPEEPMPRAPVVVGVDGSEHSDSALWFAFEQARSRRTRLVVVRTWSGVRLEEVGLLSPLRVDPAEIESAEKTALAEQVAPCLEQFADVDVETVVARGRAVRTLLDHGEGAALLVVGSRGRGGFQGMLLGSTSRALVTHAPCPVAVVREPRAVGD